MHTTTSLMKQLQELNLDPHGTILVHSSLKSVGEVDGGANTVLDVLSEYMKDGLLVLPTHTWAYINADNPRFSVLDSPSCVGILPELFRKRPDVIRSWHPTHSVAALGADAEQFTRGMNAGIRRVPVAQHGASCLIGRRKLYCWALICGGIRSFMALKSGSIFQAE